MRSWFRQNSTSPKRPASSLRRRLRLEVVEPRMMLHGDAIDELSIDAEGEALLMDETTVEETSAFAVSALAADDLTSSFWDPVAIDDEAAAFFDDSYVHEIYITFEAPDWYDTLYESHANDIDDPYFEASFVGDGIELGSIGVRFKGNSSFDGTGIKKSLKLDFNEFEQDGEDLSFLGLTKLNLNNNYNDPTMLREKLFYDYASNFVEGVSRAVHTKVYINGEYYGLYTAVEQVDKNFAQSRFGSDEDGNLYKGAAPDDAGDDPQADFGSDLTYLGADQTAYEEFYQLKTNETANDYTQLIEMIDVLNNTPSGELSDAIESLLDVDDTLASLALNNLFGNLDSYLGSAHNYYLYDRDDTGQFTHIFWDVNESFGTFTQFVDRGTDLVQLEPFWLPVETAAGPPGPPTTGEDQPRPLAENLWAVDEYSTEYLRDLAEMLREGFDVASATTRIDELADLIRDDVAADPNKQFTTAQFEQNLTTDVVSGQRIYYGLSSFIEERSTYLSSVLDVYADDADLAINELMSVNVATAQDESGDFDPWIEIYNNGPGTVSLEGLYLTDNLSDLTQWAIPAEDLGDGRFATLWVDGEIGEGSNHTSFTLSAGGGSLYLTDGTTVIDAVTYTAMASDTSLARIPDGTGDLETTDQPTFGNENQASLVNVESVEIYINEWMADNDSTIEDPDEAESYEDWIELYNPGTTAIDLSGFYLTDDASEPTQWQFPVGSTIDAGGYLVIWADGDTDQGDDHASFKLSSGGEAIWLYNVDGVSIVDTVTFGEQTTDVAYGRSPDGTTTFGQLTEATPGAANASILTAATAVEIYINEWMADNDSTIQDPDEAEAYEDWIELYNPGTAAIDLSGFYLTDDASEPTQWQFPTGSTIDAGGYLVIWADEDTDQGDDHASFKLSSGGEAIWLYNVDGVSIVDTVTFGEQTTDVSYGRYPDGSDTLVSMSTPTPGATNQNVATSDGTFDLDALIEDISIDVVDDEVLVTSGDSVLFRAAASTLLMQINGNGSDNTILFDHLALALGLNISGGDGSDLLQLVGNGHVLDLTARVIEAIESIDIRGDGANQLMLDPESALAAADILRVTVDDDDSVDFGDGFTVDDPQFVDDQFVTVLVADSGAIVQYVSSAPWINPLNPLDVNHSGDVTPLDALVILNRLNLTSAMELPTPTVDGEFPGFYYDTNGNNFLAPIDALVVLNYLNRLTVFGEGESATAMPLETFASVESTEEESEVAFEEPADYTESLPVAMATQAVPSQWTPELIDLALTSIHEKTFESVPRDDDEFLQWLNEV
ncbi:Inner spore coat protein H [Rosistilla carotiformis]|uniref:Inner spore coat protein H n=1 Tax=Rosistilla carotiformis TaxID=2528017 RepID=A0A518JYU5_9BACT|nr:CotH kinase family protein [Rosistilla carotiformis]QDV70711.1 Inner spore coat protein H [Rosistilla carotiformis]